KIHTGQKLQNGTPIYEMAGGPVGHSASWSSIKQRRPDGYPRQHVKADSTKRIAYIANCPEGKRQRVIVPAGSRRGQRPLKKQLVREGFHVDSYRALYPGGGCVHGLRLSAGQRPTEAAAPAVAASLCSRLWHHYTCQRRQLRLEAERSGRHKNGHALLPDRSSARKPDVGYRRNSRQRLQGWRFAPEAECLHGRSPAAPATCRDRLHPRQH